MSEITAGSYAARNSNGGAGNLMSKFVWGLLVAVSTAALLMAGSMLLEHDRALARQSVKNEIIDQLSTTAARIEENISLLQQAQARRDGRDAGEREFRSTRSGSGSSAP